MKKVVIPAVILLVILGLLLVIPMARRAELVRYGDEMNLHLASAEDRTATAELDGRTVELDGNAVYQIGKSLSRTEMKSRLTLPEPEGAVTVIFPDGARFTVWDDGSGEDTSFILCTYGSRTYRYAVSGYRVYFNVRKIAFPEE